jgi:hypothetical protein
MKTKLWKYGWRILLVLGMASTLALGSAQTARAMEIDRDGQVGADEVVNDDLFLANDIVEMSGTVNGNLITGGTDVTISGMVNGDVIAGGSMVNVTGTVDGNLFLVGGDIHVDGTVTGSLFFLGNSLAVGPDAVLESNAYAAGFSVNLQAGSTLERDLAVAAYQAILAGEIGRDVQAKTGAFELSGKVGRNVIVDISEPDGDAQDAEFLQFMPFTHAGRLVPVGLHILPEAVIGGRLEYHSAVEQPSGIQATPEGGVIYEYRPPENETNWDDIRDFTPEPRVRVNTFNFGRMVLNYVFGVIREFLTLILLGALGVWLIPSVLTRGAGILRDKPLPSLGWGLLVLVLGLAGLVAACILVFMLGLAVGVVTLFGLMSTVFGIGFSAIGLSGALFLAVLQYGTKLVVALLIGDTILRLFRKDYSASAFWPLLLGIVLMVFVDAIPILGFVFSLIVALFGLGALWLLFHEWWQARGAKA